LIIRGRLEYIISLSAFELQSLEEFEGYTQKPESILRQRYFKKEKRRKATHEVKGVRHSECPTLEASSQKGHLKFLSQKGEEKS